MSRLIPKHPAPASQPQQAAAAEQASSNQAPSLVIAPKPKGRRVYVIVSDCTRAQGPTCKHRFEIVPDGTPSGFYEQPKPAFAYLDKFLRCLPETKASGRFFVAELVEMSDAEPPDLATQPGKSK